MRNIEIDDRQDDEFIAEFIKRLPEKPYCCNDYTRGVKIIPRDYAIRYQHIQPSAPWVCGMICIDIDDTDAAFRWSDNGAPVPSFVVINPATCHAHYIYLLRTPVYTSNGARREPKKLLEDVSKMLRRTVGGDVAYGQNLVKNPLHGMWRVLSSDRVYGLSELRNMLDDELKPEVKTFGKVETLNTVGVGGRNVGIFNALRRWAYRAVSKYTDDDEFDVVVREMAVQMNREMETPLPVTEVLQIAKSVSRWTWEHQDDLPSSGGSGIGREQAGRNTAAQRKEGTLAKLTALAKAMGQFTMQTLADAAGMCIRTMYRYKDAIMGAVQGEVCNTVPGIRIIAQAPPAQTSPSTDDATSESEDAGQLLPVEGRDSNTTIHHRRTTNTCPSRTPVELWLDIEITDYESAMDAVRLARCVEHNLFYE